MQPFRFGDELVSSVVPCLGPEPLNLASEFSTGSGGLYLFSATPQNEGELRGEENG